MFLRLSFVVLCARRLFFWILSSVLWMAGGAVSAQEIHFSPPTPDVAARAAVLMNPITGEVLFAKEPYLRLPPASTTKVLTALVVLDQLNPNVRVPVSAQAASVAPGRIGLRAGEIVSVQDLMYGLLLKSGNDTAETLAEAVGGSVYQFANLMNTKAWQIGARGSHFMNPHGLPDDDHYTTAYDLALIFRAAMFNPLFADIVRTRSATLRIDSGYGSYNDWRMVSVHNTNRLLASYEGARGGKTGFTLKARRCFVGEADRGGVRLIVAILNSPNSGTLWRDARNLLDYGFAHYGLAPSPALIEPEPIMVHAPVVAPRVTRVPVVAPRVTRVIAQPVRMSKREHVVTRNKVVASTKASTTSSIQTRSTRAKSVVKVTKSNSASEKVVRAKPEKKSVTIVTTKSSGKRAANVAESSGRPQKNNKRRI